MSILTFLPLDLTGQASRNQRLNEKHTLITLNGKTNRLLLPQHGAFFTESLRVYNASGALLTRGTDWQATYLYHDLTTLTGKEVCAMVVILNPTINAQVSVTYQAVGGSFNVSVEELKAVIAALDSDILDITFESILGKPQEYDPEEHSHKWWQLYGFTDLNSGLKRICQNYAIGDDVILAAAEEYADKVLDDSQTALEAPRGPFDEHLINYNNPHGVTKTQIGLGNLNNWPMANELQAQDIDSADVYMSVGNVYQALELAALPVLQGHLGQTGNPHQVTPGQLNAYTYNEQLEAIQARSASHVKDDGSGVTVVQDSLALDWYTLDEVIVMIHASLDASLVTSGQFDRRRLGTNVANGRFLMGDRTFQPYQNVFDQYAPKAHLTLYVGLQANDVDAVSYLNATYGDTNAYPVGTVALVRIPMTWGTNTDGGGYTTLDFDEVHMAQRTASGWVMQ